MDPGIETIRHYLMQLQAGIANQIGALDGSPFQKDPWQKPNTESLQGSGLTLMLEKGSVFERAGIGYSDVVGTKLPASASQTRPDLTNLPFRATGVSLVFHPENPYVPTVHMNVRMLAVTQGNGSLVTWFGGGMDLTPYYGFEEDAVHFHQTCRDALNPFGTHLYPTFKTWCDDYFYLKHRQEQRGIGGIFFDDFSEFDSAKNFGMLQSVGNAFMQAYLPIVKKRMHTPYGKRERSHQLYRRGRYVEFNLVWDRGTHFGLQSGGRSESILLSMPPLVSWAYQQEARAGTPEHDLMHKFIVRRAWL